MKRIAIISLILALALTACSAPIGQTSPSHNGQVTYNPAGDSGLSHAADYAALIKIVQKAQGNSNYRYYRTMGPTFDMAVSGAEKTQTTSGSTTNYSQTNIQVAGVDEADIIKTDGSYLYLVTNNRLYIVDARDPANLAVLSTQVFTISQETDKFSSGESPLQMYLDPENQRLTLIISGWLNEKVPVEQPAATDGVKPDQSNASDGSTAVEPATGADIASSKMASSLVAPNFMYNNKQYTTTRIYDISDKAAPKMVRQFTQTGYYLNSRKIGSAVYVVTNEYQYRVYAEDTSKLDPKEIFPATSSTIGTISLENWNTIPADKISILPNGDVSNQMVISGIDTLSDKSEPSLLAVLGTSGTVYASTGYLYVAAYNYPLIMRTAIGTKGGAESTTPEKVEEATTEIYRFKLANGAVSEAGKGTVPGTILNQYSMDEYDGNFRIATTTGQMWNSGDNVAKNNVFILDPSLKMIGQVTGLAPGETIKSVRFMGAQAYVVTFRNVDPLFVIDLSKPAAPQVLGQLKIPGYSTYLHPYADNMLLGFGYDVKNEGNNAYNMGLKVSLFDISDFNNPKELSTILLGGRGSYAEVLDNPKALLFSKEKNLIAFPATLTKTITNNPLEYGQPVFQGMLILSVTGDNQITLRGQVTHFDKLNDPNGDPATLTQEESNAFYGFDAISRGAWIDNALFTITSRQIRSTSLDSLEKLGAVELPGFKEFAKYYYGYGVKSEGTSSGSSSSSEGASPEDLVK